MFWGFKMFMTERTREGGVGVVREFSLSLSFFFSLSFELK